MISHLRPLILAGLICSTWLACRATTQGLARPAQPSDEVEAASLVDSIAIDRELYGGGCCSAGDLVLRRTRPWSLGRYEALQWRLSTATRDSATFERVVEDLFRNGLFDLESGVRHTDIGVDIAVGLYSGQTCYMAAPLYSDAMRSKSWRGVSKIADSIIAQTKWQVVDTVWSIPHYCPWPQR